MCSPFVHFLTLESNFIFLVFYLLKLIFVNKSMFNSYMLLRICLCKLIIKNKFLRIIKKKIIIFTCLAIKAEFKSLQNREEQYGSVHMHSTRSLYRHKCQRAQMPNPYLSSMRISLFPPFSRVNTLHSLLSLSVPPSKYIPHFGFP